jgi:hypothetical protein
MASAERAFLLLAGHMQNELNSLNKVFGWCLHNPRSDHTSPIEGLANNMQAMIYARVLAGKLLEAWKMLGKAFVGTNLSQRVESKLHPIAQDALKKINSYFGKKNNAIYRVRNVFAFHYSVKEFDTNWKEAADEPTFELVLGGTVGNNLHLAAEFVANTALLNEINSNDKADALRTFFDEVQSIASSFTDFLEGTIVAILEERLGSGLTTLGREEEIFPTRSYNEVAIPFFCKPDPS